MELKTPAQFKGKEAFYAKMVTMFANSFPNTWASFDDAVADAENTKSLVHKIKGTAGNLNIDEIYQYAQQFELSLHDKKPDRNLYQMFIDSCDALRNSLT